MMKNRALQETNATCLIRVSQQHDRDKVPILSTNVELPKLAATTERPPIDKEVIVRTVKGF